MVLTNVATGDCWNHVSLNLWERWPPPRSFLFLVVRPGATNSFLLLVALASNLIATQVSAAGRKRACFSGDPSNCRPVFGKSIEGNIVTGIVSPCPTQLGLQLYVARLNRVDPQWMDSLSVLVKCKNKDTYFP